MLLWLCKRASERPNKLESSDEKLKRCVEMTGQGFTRCRVVCRMKLFLFLWIGSFW